MTYKEYLRKGRSLRVRFRKLRLRVRCALDGFRLYRDLNTRLVVDGAGFPLRTLDWHQEELAKFPWCVRTDKHAARLITEEEEASADWDAIEHEAGVEGWAIFNSGHCLLDEGLTEEMARVIVRAVNEHYATASVTTYAKGVPIGTELHFDEPKENS